MTLTCKIEKESEKFKILSKIDEFLNNIIFKIIIIKINIIIILIELLEYEQVQQSFYYAIVC